MQVTLHVEIPGDRAAVLKRSDEIVKALSPDTIVGAYIDHEYDPDDPDEEELHDVYMCDISEARAKQAAEIAVHLARDGACSG